MNPVESYLNDYYGDEKVAGIADIWKSIRTFGGKAGDKIVSNLKSTGAHTLEAAPNALALAGVTAAVGHAGGAIDNIYAAATKERDFKNMLEFNPDLAEQHKTNPKYINASFNTLRNINQKFSKDPMVAGAYVRQVAESPLSAYGSAAEALRVMPPPSPILHAAMQAAQQATRPDASLHMQGRMDNIRHENEMRRIDHQYHNSIDAKTQENRQRAMYDRWHNENTQAMRDESAYHDYNGFPPPPASYTRPMPPRP